ncbi:MAG: cupin domain-containing protein [bacterium]|nr:cupin domain-containing protein [bacterium]
MRSITVYKNPSNERIEELGALSWPIWTCEPSTFPWTYDSAETCLLIEGDVIVTPEEGEPVRFGKGDLVSFPEGMSCTWEVKVAVKKHYRFS